MASEIVELTVVGIRNYCPGEEDGLPELFDRHPVGKILFMKINPSGSKFPGSVSVYDGIGNIIGSISKTDRRFIELAIPQDGMLPCKVVGHSLEHNCMYVEAENNVGFKEPYIRQTSVEEGELIFGITEEDERLKTLTQLIQTQLSLPVHDCRELVEVANEYAKICCTSLDGETSFARADILRQLKKVNNGSGVLDNAINKIFEDTKDLGRKYNDVKTTVYRNQYNRIFASANTKKHGKPSELETYIKSLAFRNGNILTQEVIKEEVDKLSIHLANEFMGTFVEASETDEDFATALYSLNYSLRAIYVMYTRRIKREYLLEMLENPLTVGDEQTSNSIADAILYVMEFKDEKGQYIFTQKNQWFAIYRILADMKIVQANGFLAFGRFIDGLNLTDIRVDLNARELSKNNKGTLSERFEKWNRSKAVSPIQFDKINRIAQLFKAKIEELIPE